ncbi:transposase [Anaerohalosphaeraceae bacterium U12dextr]
MSIIFTTWMGLLQQFFPVFTAPGSEIFIRLMIGWVLCTARRTISGILPFADPTGQHAHDAYRRFFPDGCWQMSRLWQGLAVLLVKALRPGGILIVALDDTLFHHSGRKVDGAGIWRDGVRSTASHLIYAWGLNLVVLTVQIQPPWGGEPLGLLITL